MKPLSNDLRERVLAAVDNREGSRRQLAARFAVNVSAITRRLGLRRQTGSFDPRPHGGGTEPTLDPRGLRRLRELVAEDPDATLEQLRQRLGLSGSLIMVWRGSKKLDITRKKEALRATERESLGIQPALRPGDVVIFDNLAAHLRPEVTLEDVLGWFRQAGSCAMQA